MWVACSASSALLAQSPVAANGPLRVVGNQILNQHDRPVSFAGNSFFWSNSGWGAEGFYQAKTVRYLKSQWGASIVRVAMGVEAAGGYIDDPDGNQNRIEAVIDAALQEGLYVIVDWHSHQAEEHQTEAIEFFQEIARKYGEQPNLIYELYNEPIRQSWSEVIKPYAVAVASAIREIDQDNLILVGSSTWSQDVDIAAAAPLIGFGNLAYTVHFYAGTHGVALRDKIDRALALEVPVVVSEWGSVNANGDGEVAVDETERWVEFMRQRGLTHLNWSVHNKAEGASVFNPDAPTDGGWSDRHLTASGRLVKQIVSTWPKSTVVINAGMSGAWFNPRIDGQGWLFDIIEKDPLGQMFVAWFTYNNEFPATNELDGFGSRQHRWFTASGPFSGNQAELDIQLNSGGVFNQDQPNRTELVGTLVVDFDSCVKGRLTYNFHDQTLASEQVDIVRISPDAFCRTRAAQRAQ